MNAALMRGLTIGRETCTEWASVSVMKGTRKLLYRYP